MAIIFETKRVAYYRKSSENEDRQVLSIPAQIEEINKVAQSENFTYKKTFSESHSAKNPGRPVFEEMLEYIESGNANGIVTWAPNRLSRNSIDTGRIIHLMDLGKLMEVRTPGQIFRNNPNDKFLLSLFCSQAKLENDNKGEDVKRGLKAKVQQGWFPGSAPVGYKNTPDLDKGFKIIIKDPDRFILIRKIWDMALTGRYSVRRIHTIAKEELQLSTVKRKRIGGKPLSMSGIYSLLNNPFYSGEFEFPYASGNYYEGKHEPMITREEFRQVQLRLGAKGKPRIFKKRFAYTGPVMCGECGCQITAEEKHQIICSSCKTKFSFHNKTNCPKCDTAIKRMNNPKMLHYVYYHCTKQKQGYTCSQKSIEIGEFEKQLTAYLNKISIKKSYLDWAVKYLKEDNAFAAETNEIILKSRQKEQIKISNQLENLLELRLNGEITLEEFQAKRSNLISAKEELQKLILTADHSQTQRIDTCINFFEYCYAVLQKFEDAKRKNNLEAQKDILCSLGSNLILKDKKLFISLLKPFEIVSDGLTNMPVVNPTFEPEKELEIKGQNTHSGHEFTKWLPVVEEVRTYYLSQETAKVIDITRQLQIRETG